MSPICRIATMCIRYFPLCLILFAVCGLTGASDTYFEILDNADHRIVGTISAIDQTQIVADVQGESCVIPLEKLVKIRNLAPSSSIESPSAMGNVGQQPAPTARTTRSPEEQKLANLIEKHRRSHEQTVQTFPSSVVSLEFNDGSCFVASSLTLSKSHGTCRLLDQQDDLSFPLAPLSAVRFAVRNLHDVLNPPADWLRLAVPTTEGDRLIVGNPGSFDVYAGILQEINAETIFFSVDDEVLPVPRRKVFGLVLHGDSTPPADEFPLAVLTLWTGTRGMVSSLRLNENENELTVQTTAGVTIAVPLYMVDEIDFGEQKGVVSLFDCERVRSEFSLPFVSGIELEQLPFLRQFYESRTNVSREIVLDGICSNRGMTLLGKTVLEYHLPKPFAVLKAVIGIEDQFRPQACASLQILANSQVLGTWELRGDTASQRIHLNLPQNCRLITLIAEPIPHSTVPAVLSIADPKLFE